MQLLPLPHSAADCLQTYIRSTEGKAAVASIEAASKKQYPQYWEELEGIVDGSGIPRELVSQSLHTGVQNRVLRLS